jgi:hypothetical protein
MNIDYSNIKQDKYVVQGLTIIDNLFFISAYKKNNLSRIYVYSENEYLGKIILDNKWHVGGISFDKKNNIIFVTGSAKSISTYNYTKIRGFIKKDFVLDLNEHLDLVIKNNLTTPFRAATLFIYKGYIYITKFDIHTKIAKIKYEYNKKNVKEVKIVDLGTINNSFCVQGICFYKNELYLSSSLGTIKSVISVYDHNFKLVNRRMIKQMGIEGIIIKDNILYSIYEMGKPRIATHKLNTLNLFKTKTLFLIYKYAFTYKIYKRIKNRKRK